MKRARSCSSRVEVRNGSRCGVLSGRRCGRRVEVRNGSRGSAWGLLVGLGGCRISMTSYYMFFFNRALASTRSSLPLRVASFPLSHRAGIPEIYRPLTVHVRSARPPHPGVHNASQSSCTPTGYEGTRSCTPTVASRDARPPLPPRTSGCSTGSRWRAPTAAPRGAHPSPPPCTCACPTGSRSRATTAAPRDARPPPQMNTYVRPTGNRSRATTAAPRGARPSPRTGTSTRPTGSHSRAPTAAHRVARLPPLKRTSYRPTGIRSRATTATFRAVRSSPLRNIGIVYTTGDLAVAGAATRLNIRASRLSIHQAPQNEAPEVGCISALQRLQRGGQLSCQELLCQAAARSGQLEELKALRADGWPWDQEACSAAALDGHLEVLQWARANGCPWGRSTCRWAAKGGHLEVLRWARANGCP